MRAAGMFLLAIFVGAACVAAGYAWGLTRARVMATAATYVFGRAVDAEGTLVSGVRVELGTQSSTTNESGQWGISRALAAGEVLLYVFPEVARVEPPPGVKVILQSGNVLRLTVPAPVPAQLGPFVLMYGEGTTQTATSTVRPSPTWTRTATPTPTPIATVTPPMPPTGTATPGPTPYPTRPTPWWLEGLKPGYYRPPAFVERTVLLDLYLDWGWDWGDCFYKFAAVYNLGLPCGPLVKMQVCDAGECVMIRYRLWGKGDLALIARDDDPCLVGIIYNPDNGDGRWHPAGTVTP